MKQKNLLYIFADQWRWHATGFAGCDPVATPHMDAFAKKGMQFNNAISTYPLCSPHRAALLTGKHPTSCGMWTNCKPGLSEVVLLKPQETCISDVLHAAGYRTGYIGKWHLDASELNFTSAPISGARGWDAYTPPGERRHGFDFWHSYGAMDNHTNPHYWENTPVQIKPNQWSLSHETDVAISFLQRQAENPFCLFVSWNPPHPPYDLLPEEIFAPWAEKVIPFRDNVPDSMRQDMEFLRKRQQYFAAIEAMDTQFGRLMETLESQGLWEDTVVVLSADHGDCMGSHGLYGKNVWYEESIRIPLVFAGGGIAAGKSNCLLASADHAPTLLELLGQAVPPIMEGQSFAKAALGQEMKAPQDAFLCMMPGMPEMVAEYTRLGLNSKCFGWRGLRTQTHTYVVDAGTAPHAPQTRLLYDNVADPYQLHPVALKAGDTLDAPFAQRLRVWLKRLNDGFLIDA